MEVEKKIGRKCKFKEICDAEVFLCSGHTFIKTGYELEDGTNAVDLEDGDFETFDPDAEVIEVESRLVIS